MSYTITYKDDEGLKGSIYDDAGLRDALSLEIAGGVLLEVEKKGDVVDPPSHEAGEPMEDTTAKKIKRRPYKSGGVNVVLWSLVSCLINY